ncbi:hypothetical protein BC828DRAFT_388111 [Blastocladiella britannica]|nr:hypothetical protein BC828DRAFT_388111 [Blastocladiella britannica]
MELLITDMAELGRAKECDPNTDETAMVARVLAYEPARDLTAPHTAYGVSALHVAAYYGLEHTTSAIVQLQKQQQQLQSTHSSANTALPTPLMLAAFRGSAGTISVLLESGAAGGFRTIVPSTGWTAAHYAAVSPWHPISAVAALLGHAGPARLAASDLARPSWNGAVPRALADWDVDALVSATVVARQNGNGGTESIAAVGLALSGSSSAGGGGDWLSATLTMAATAAAANVSASGHLEGKMAQLPARHAFWDAVRRRDAADLAQVLVWPELATGPFLDTSLDCTRVCMASIFSPPPAIKAGAGGAGVGVVDLTSL